MFGRARKDKYPSLTRDEKLSGHVTPWANEFRDDTEALKEFAEGDVFVRELQGDCRRVFSSHVDSFCALDLNVVRTRHSRRAIPPPATRQKQEEVTEIETYKKLQCRRCTKEGQRCTEFYFHTKRACRVKRVPCFWVTRTDKAVPYENDNFHRLPYVRNRFPEIGNSANFTNDRNAKRRQILRRACNFPTKRRKRKPPHLVRHRMGTENVVAFQDHATTRQDHERREAVRVLLATVEGQQQPAWVKICRQIEMFERLGEAHKSQIIFATKGSISDTWKRRVSWGPASTIHFVGGCTREKSNRSRGAQQRSDVQVAGECCQERRSCWRRLPRAPKLLARLLEVPNLLARLTGSAEVAREINESFEVAGEVAKSNVAAGEDDREHRSCRISGRACG